jgi:hypothetical protein
MNRVSDPYTSKFLPGLILLLQPFTGLTVGFRALQIFCIANLWGRWRNKSVDPEIEETYLRAMLEENKRISELFKVETMHVLDYDCEYQTACDTEEFPEFNNKYFKFFNADTGMTKGHFVFGDLESNATMKVSFETMPVQGKSRFCIGEPFYYFDVVIEINHNGVYEKIVLVDRKESLNKVRPFISML